MSRRLVPGTLVVLLVLSGCTGTLNGGTATPDATATHPPENVSIDDATLPPGVDESGVTNATKLVAAHNQTLRAEGFALNGTFERVLDDGRTQTRRYHTEVAPGANRFSTGVRTTLSATVNGSDEVYNRQEVHVWSNATETIRQVTINNETMQGPVDNVPTNLALTRAPQYRSYLSIGEFDVENAVERGDNTYTTLVADSTRDSFDANETIHARFVVDERGVIHEAVVTLSAGPDSRTDHAHYRIIEFGASPERPEWVSEPDS